MKASKLDWLEKIFIFLNFKLDMLWIKYKIFVSNLFLKIWIFKKKNRFTFDKILGVNVLFKELKINFNIILLIKINN